MKKLLLIDCCWMKICYKCMNPLLLQLLLLLWHPRRPSVLRPTKRSMIADQTVRVWDLPPFSATKLADQPYLLRDTGSPRSWSVRVVSSTWNKGPSENNQIDLQSFKRTTSLTTISSIQICWCCPHSDNINQDIVYGFEYLVEIVYMPEPLTVDTTMTTKTETTVLSPSYHPSFCPCPLICWKPETNRRSSVSLVYIYMYKIQKNPSTTKCMQLFGRHGF